jgi:hypothetical protein
MQDSNLFCRLLQEHGGSYTRLSVGDNSKLPSAGCSSCNDDTSISSKKICRGVPVFVMLPLDTVKVVHNPDGSSESCIQNELSLDIALQTLKSVGVQVCFCSRGKASLLHMGISSLQLKL